MSRISLAPGESQKIVSQPGRNKAYNIDVSGADVYLSHSESRTVGEGKRVRPGDRVTVDNLEGKSVFAKNPPANTDTATVDINDASFNLIFQPRAVQASVQASEDNEAAPATDDFVHQFATGVDVNAATETVGPFDAPGRADKVKIHVDDAGGAFNVGIDFLNPDTGAVVTRRDENDSSIYSGDSTTDVFVTPDIVSPRVRVDIRDASGAQNTVDYNVYVR